MAGIRLFDGSKWVTVGGDKSRVWDGYKWVSGKSRLWDGYHWQLITGQRKVAVFDAVNSGGYWSEKHGNLSHNHYNSLWKPNYPVQGSYDPYHDRWESGNYSEGGMIYFNDGAIRNELQGAKIEKVEVYLFAVWSGFNNGGQAVIGCHNFRGNWSDKFQEINHGVAKARFYKRNQGQWITLPNWVGDNFRDNKLAGITTKGDGGQLWQYLVYAGSNYGWQKPKLRFTYTK